MYSNDVSFLKKLKISAVNLAAKLIIGVIGSVSQNS